MLEYYRDAYNVSELLSTSNRDFLVRSNGEQVKVDSLKGKMVGILMATNLTCLSSRYLYHIIEAYNELIPKNDFEICFVAMLEDDADVDEEFEDDAVVDEEAFYGLFSRMPWLAVPFSDVGARTQLSNLFGDVQSHGIAFPIINAQGQVLRGLTHLFLQSYGADIYPFTPDLIQGLQDEYVAACSDMSLSSLLGCDFVISNQGNKVPISELEGKVVGLYIYGSRLSLPLMPVLLEIYEKLKRKGDINFEIVFVNVHFLDNGYSDEESFKQGIGGMPWLALPFKDKRCKKLWRMFDYYYVGHGEDGVFVTIGSDGKSIDQYSAKVVLEYGIEAYPFTRDQAAECEMRKLKARTIRQIFDSANIQVLIRKNGVRIPVSQVFGKYILLYIGSGCCSYERPSLAKVVKCHKVLCKKKDHRFEVIYLSIDDDEASFNNLLGKLPWPAIPIDNKMVLYDLLRDALRFDFNCPQLTVFGPDGRLLAFDALSLLHDHGVDAPKFFTDEQLVEEVGDMVSVRLDYPVVRDGKVYYLEGSGSGPDYTSGHVPNYY